MLRSSATFHVMRVATGEIQETAPDGARAQPRAFCGRTLCPAQLGDALLAAQALQDDADLLFCRELPACRPPDVFHDFSHRFLRQPGFLSCLRSLKGYVEREIPPSSTRPICLVGADAGDS